MAKVRKVSYKVFGENDKVIAKGSCLARTNDCEMEDVLTHSGVNWDLVWSIETKG